LKEVIDGKRTDSVHQASNVVHGKCASRLRALKDAKYYKVTWYAILQRKKVQYNANASNNKDIGQIEVSVETPKQCSESRLRALRDAKYYKVTRDAIVQCQCQQQQRHRAN
jgi:hypothetical protein